MLILSLWLLLVPWATTLATCCPETCSCSTDHPEDLVSINCLGLQALLLPNETLQVECLMNHGKSENWPVKLPLAHEVSLTSCQPADFANADTKSLFLRNVTRKTNFGDWPTLQKLDISSNKLEILTSRFLNGLQGLRQLDISKCQIHMMFPSCFEGFTLLKELYLEGNELDEIEDNQFATLNNLWLLHLWGNKLRRISNHSFTGLINLRHLDLSHNRISSLSKEVLAHMPHLELLDLSSNDFVTLPSNLLQHNRHLEVFKLEGNARRIFKEKDAEWLQSLELPQGLLADLSKLTRVSFRNSAVAIVPRFLLRGSASLKYLDLKGNRLTEIPRFFLQDASQLKWLDLSGNDLHIVQDDMLISASLQHLNLSDNNLEVIPHGEVYENIEVLDLRDNLLTLVPKNVYHQFKKNLKLRELFFVRGNRWDCDNRYTKEFIQFIAAMVGIATDLQMTCSD